MDELIPERGAPLGDVTARLLIDWLSGRKPATVRAYGKDILAFAGHLGVKTSREAVRWLLTSTPGEANALALRWKAAMLDAQMAPATVNRRLAALRSLVQLARRVGQCTFEIQVDNVRGQPYRDTRGPGKAGVMRIMAQARAQGGVRAARDLAVVRLLWDLALRRQEIAELDLAHLDLQAATLSILGKGERERRSLGLPEPTRKALAAWVAVRGFEAGPLFLSRPRGSAPIRLDGHSIFRLVRRLAARAGLNTRPHGIRHAAITEALGLVAGDLRQAASYSRHRNINTLTYYDDQRRDLGGEVAKLVAGSIPEPEMEETDERSRGASD